MNGCVVFGLRRVVIVVYGRKCGDLYMVGWSNGGSSLSGCRNYQVKVAGSSPVLIV